MAVPDVHGQQISQKAHLIGCYGNRGDFQYMYHAWSTRRDARPPPLVHEDVLMQFAVFFVIDGKPV